MTDMTVDNESRFTGSTCSPTNHYSDDEWHQIKTALEDHEQINQNQTWNREKWLKSVGPTLVMVRDRAWELSGATRVTSQAFRDAMGEELKRTGLDAIHKTTRSYLLKIMNDLPAVEEWLAQLTNPDRLNHPKTIWKAFQKNKTYDNFGVSYERIDHGWEDETGNDYEDGDDFLKEWEPEDEEIPVAPLNTGDKDAELFASLRDKAEPNVVLSDEAHALLCGDDEAARAYFAREAAHETARVIARAKKEERKAAADARGDTGDDEARGDDTGEQHDAHVQNWLERHKIGLDKLLGKHSYKWISGHDHERLFAFLTKETQKMEEWKQILDYKDSYVHCDPDDLAIADRFINAAQAIREYIKPCGRSYGFQLVLPL
jgi:hypothetical protein